MSSSSVKRTELIKTNSPLPFVKTNITLGHMDYCELFPCAKVPGGCRLQVEQIARDVQCRKPSSKDDIMRSSWFCCYSNCDRFDLFVTVLIRFEKKTVATIPKHLFVVLICYVMLTLSFVKIFSIWTGNRAADFQVYRRLPVTVWTNCAWCTMS